MQLQTLANLRCVKFVLKLISPNIPNLNLSLSLSLFQEHICFYSMALQGISESSFNGWCRHLFSTQFRKLKRYINFIRLILLLLHKPMRFLNSSGRRFRQKNIHCKDCSSKLYFSKGIQNNQPRSNFYCYGYHKCYLRKPKG